MNMRLLDDMEDDVGTFEVTASPSQDELLPLLECPVCFDLPLPPIRTCYQGHIICAECCPKLSGCPLCQSPIGYGRNFFAEDFVSKSTMRCKYRVDGCSKLLFGSDVREHVKLCQFRPIECRYCPKMIMFRDFEKHLQIQHRVSRWDINDNGCKILKEAKRRVQTDDPHPPVQSNMFYNFLFKSLFVAIMVSFLIDHLMEMSYTY